MFIYKLLTTETGFIVEEQNIALPLPSLIALTESITKVIEEHKQCLIIPNSLKDRLTSSLNTSSIEICSNVLDTAIQQHQHVRMLTEEETESCRRVTRLMQSFSQSSQYGEFVQNIPLSLPAIIEKTSCSFLSERSKISPATPEELEIQKQVALIEKALSENPFASSSNSPKEPSQPEEASVSYVTLPSLTHLYPLLTSVFVFDISTDTKSSTTTVTIKKSRKSSIFDHYHLYKTICRQFTYNQRNLTAILENSDLTWILAITDTLSPSLPASTQLLHSDPRTYLAMASALNYNLECLHKIARRVPPTRDIVAYQKHTKNASAMITSLSSKYSDAFADSESYPEPCPLQTPNPLTSSSEDFCLTSSLASTASSSQSQVAIPSTSLEGSSLVPTSGLIFSFAKRRGYSHSIDIKSLYKTSETPFRFYQKYVLGIKALYEFVPFLLNSTTPITLHLPKHLRNNIPDLLQPDNLYSVINKENPEPFYYWAITAALYYSLSCFNELCEKIQTNPNTAKSIQTNAHLGHCKKITDAIQACKDKYRSVCNEAGFDLEESLNSDDIFVFPAPNPLAQTIAISSQEMTSSLSVESSTKQQIHKRPSSTQYSDLQKACPSKKPLIDLHTFSLSEEAFVADPSDDEDTILETEEEPLIDPALIRPKRNAPLPATRSPQGDSSTSLSKHSLLTLTITSTNPATNPVLLTPQTILETSATQLAEFLTWESSSPNIRSTITLRANHHKTLTSSNIHLMIAKAKTIKKISYTSYATNLATSIRSCIDTMQKPHIELKLNTHLEISSPFSQEETQLFVLLFIMKIAYARIIEPFVRPKNKHRQSFEQVKRELEQACEKILNPSNDE